MEHQLYVVGCAESFLEFMCFDMPENTYAEVLQSDLFITWFKNQWNLRDEAFMVEHRVPEVLEMDVETMRYTLEHMYRGMHYIAMMTSGLRQSFSLVLADIIRERFKHDTKQEHD